MKSPLWVPLKVKTVVQIDPAVLEEYEGNHQYADYPEYGVVVAKEGDLLVFQETPGGLCYELYPESETIFSLSNGKSRSPSSGTTTAVSRP
jgi:hypothetical protein